MVVGVLGGQGRVAQLLNYMSDLLCAQLLLLQELLLVDCVLL